MAWLRLLAASLFEVGITTALRDVDHTRPGKPMGLFLWCAALCFYVLTLSLHDLPIGTAYAGWTSIGTAGTVLVGRALYSEPLSACRLRFLARLIGSIIGLKLG